MSIDPRTRLGAIRLTVADRELLRDFYERTIGLRVIDDAEHAVSLGTPDCAVLVELVHDPAAPPRPSRTTGLFHLALLVDGRAELARCVRRVVDGGARLTGASDHLVSEALYLHDPEGNGIELYRDRPRDEWRKSGAGELEMGTFPLDLDAVMAELPDGADTGMSAATTLGHVHLNVADIAASEAFYCGLLGFDAVVRGYPGALFVSAGGYHHHLGLNTWNGAGAPPPPDGSRGLRSFDVVLPGTEVLEALVERAESAGVPVARNGASAELTDPSGNRLVLRA